MNVFWNADKLDSFCVADWCVEDHVNTGWNVQKCATFRLAHWAGNTTTCSL